MNAIKIGIYAIVNNLNGKIYIGSSENVERRFKQHQYLLEKGRHPNKYLQRAYQVSGRVGFRYMVLEEVFEKSLLTKIEQEWIEKLKSADRQFGYNLMLDAERCVHSFESRVKMSKSRQGMPKSEEHKMKLRKNLRQYSSNRQLSPEHKAKIGEASKGRIPTPETRAKLSVWQKGKKKGPLPLETRKKMSEAHKGKPKSEEHRAKIGLAQKGRKLSDEQRERLSEIQRNRSPETRAKLSEANGKLTVEQVIEIRQRFANGENMRALSREFSVSRGSISEIIHRKTYKHLP